MTTTLGPARGLAALALLAAFAATAHAQPAAVTAEWALKQQPKHPGVNVSTPAPDAVARCKVDPIPNPKGGAPLGYTVRDPEGKPLRVFVSYDNKNFNIVSYYLDGAEAYREIYPPAAEQPAQFRWLGANGSKWGYDRNRDNVIDEWAVISPEEATQELLKALASNDAAKLNALLVTKENLAAIGLPAADANALSARAAGAAKKFADAVGALKLSDKAKWVHAEFGAPHTRAADSFEGRDDYTAYKNGTVLIEDGGKTAFVQTGELIQIGRAWKLVDGPSVEAAGGGDTAGPVVDNKIAALVTKLNDLDKAAPNPPTIAALAEFNAKRAELLEQIVAVADQKEQWAKMLIDSLAQAAEGDKPGGRHIERVKQWRDDMTKPGGNPTLAAYAAFRLLTAENSVAMAHIRSNDELPGIQDKWRAGLESYLKDFAKSADAPEAAWRLAMAWELSGQKDGEAKARPWYDTIIRDYGTHSHAAKAKGALKRLDSEGKPLELSGPALANGLPVNPVAPGKVVVVYYWASWSSALADDAKKLAALEKEYGPKGLVLVTVGLDHEAQLAKDAVAKVGLPGTHLFAPGGLDNSPLAASYGVLAPPQVLVAGKDGKVANRNAAVAGLEEEVKKLLEAK
jgi:thiol-disulfide isomerase/thioredoxin